MTFIPLSPPARFALALLALGLCGGCKTLAGLSAKPKNNTVFVVGTLHGAHRTEEVYTLERFGEILRRLDPDVVLVQIPPASFEVAWQQFLRDGQVSEPRVKDYVEFTEVLFPIALEGRFRIVPVSAWNEAHAQRRDALLQQWKSTRPADTQKVERALSQARGELESRGLAHEPSLIHSAAYDTILAEGWRPYETIFGDDLGPGSWKESNRAHSLLIGDALDEISGEGRRVLVIFGVEHKYLLRESLEKREDINLLRLPQGMQIEAVPGNLAGQKKRE